GLSVREIAENTGASKSTVQNIRKRHLPDIETSKGGRPKKLSRQDSHYCSRLITSGGAQTATDVAKLLRDCAGMHVSRQTVARALNSQGMNAAEKEEKPRLSPKNIRDRLKFAKSHKDWTVGDWKQVVWSDETKINRFCSDGRSWCWKREG